MDPGVRLILALVLGWIGWRVWRRRDERPRLGVVAVVLWAVAVLFLAFEQLWEFLRDLWEIIIWE